MQQHNSTLDNVPNTTTNITYASYNIGRVRTSWDQLILKGEAQPEIQIFKEWYNLKLFCKWAISSGYQDNYVLFLTEEASSSSITIFSPTTCEWMLPAIARERRKIHRLAIKGVSLSEETENRIIEEYSQNKITIQELAEKYDLKISDVHHITKKSSVKNGKIKPPKGSSYERLYTALSGMLLRCNDPTNINYRWYGGRGIVVCDEWVIDYLKFKSWALENGYNDTLTIERKDPNGNYCPENCEWITRAENTRRAMASARAKKQQNK